MIDGNKDHLPGADRRLVDWRGEDVDGFRTVRRLLPVRSESLTQLGRGVLQAEANVITGSEATLYYASVGTHCATHAELNPTHTGFVIPIVWQEPFVINGEQVEASSIYAPVDGTLFQVCGRSRKTVAIGLLRADFIATIAALRGVDPNEVSLDEGALEVAPAALGVARRRMRMMLENYTDMVNVRASPQGAAESLVSCILESIIDLYLLAAPAPARKICTATRFARIVRKAEERYEAAEHESVALADLCLAAGVSQGTLYRAFDFMCDSSPIDYFRKRRLTDARHALLSAEFARGAVKRAALDCGFTHLGRFSVEYRNQFGESPMVTLNRARV